MAKVAAAQARLYKNLFICRKCKHTIKADGRKIILGKIKCRKCGSTAFRTRRKK